MNFEGGLTSPYDTLGVPFGASIEICEASYKALIKVFHPDAFKGDKAFAEKRSIELNSAISFLKDVNKKQAYDKKFADINKQAKQEYREEEASEFANASETFHADWEFACKYYPDLAGYHNELRKLNAHYAGLFIAIIVDQKLYHEAGEISKYLEDEFLNSKFSNDKQLKQLAKISILKQKRHYARELNTALKVLGIRSKEKILRQLSRDFPEFSRVAYKEVGLFKYYEGGIDGDKELKNPWSFGKRVEDEDFTELKKQFEKNYSKSQQGSKFPFRR